LTGIADWHDAFGKSQCRSRIDQVQMRKHEPTVGPAARDLNAHLGWKFDGFHDESKGTGWGAVVGATTSINTSRLLPQ